MNLLGAKLKQTVWLALAWSILIFILLTLPTEKLPDDEIFDISDLDKFIHFSLFGFFLWIWAQWWAARKAPAPTNLRDVFTIFLITCAYGIGMEFYQKFFTNRSFDFGDIIADTLGAIAGAAVFMWRKKISPYRNRGRNQN